MSDEMCETKLLNEFFRKIEEDVRINAFHISVYVALVHLWLARERLQPLVVFSYEVMPYCKISASSTYHRIIRQLDAFGYIRYKPSYNHNAGSKVFFQRFH